VLHGVHVVGGSCGLRETFDSDDVGAIELEDHGNAGGDGAIIHSIGIERRCAEEDGTGTAIAFGADDFCAGESAMTADVVGEGKKGSVAADFMAAAVNEEEDKVPHTEVRNE